MALRIIKRYSNRKLYDQTDHKWVKLADIARMVSEGEEIQVLDHTSGEDITERILADALSRELRSGRSPIRLLKKILSYAGHGVIGFFKTESRTVEVDESFVMHKLLQKLPELEAEFDSMVEELMRRKMSEMSAAPDTEALRQEIRQGFQTCAREIRELKDEIQDLKEELKRLTSSR